MIQNAVDKLKLNRDMAFSQKRFDAYNTYCEIIRLIYRSDAASANKIAAGIDKIIAYVEQGHFAHTDKDVKRLCNAAKRIK